MLVISLQRYAEAGQTWTRVSVHSDNMELVADVVQDLAKYFKWTELESQADFPAEFEVFQQVVSSVAECNAARMNLTADMADDAQRIKVCLVFLLIL
jgi:lactate dehydrogenase-like 2-hydroxyacid dehydrogenase